MEHYTGGGIFSNVISRHCGATDRWRECGAELKVGGSSLAGNGADEPQK